MKYIHMVIIMSNEQIVECIQNNQDVQQNMLALWQQNQKFIRKIALMYRNFEDVEDLIQQAYFGLLAAVEGYNPSEGVLFLTYAEYWIRQSMKRYIEQNSYTVRIPGATRARIDTYSRFTAAMMSQYGRRPSDVEMCTYMGISEKELDTIKQGLLFEHVKSIDVPIGDDGSVYLYELIQAEEDTERTVIDSIQLEELKKVLWGMVGELTQKEQEVIKLKYQDNKTMPEIERYMNFKRYAAASIHQKAINELRRPHRINRLQTFRDEYIETQAMKGIGVGTFSRTWTSATERVALK